MADSGMGGVGEYITFRHNSVSQYIGTRSIFDIVMAWAI